MVIKKGVINLVDYIIPYCNLERKFGGSIKALRFLQLTDRGTDIQTDNRMMTDKTMEGRTDKNFAKLSIKKTNFT